MRFSKKVNFKPWIGEDYLKQETKIMILGLSMYEDDRGDVPDDPNSTKWRVIHTIKGDFKAQFFTTIYNLMTQEASLNDFTDHSKEEFWHKVVFYNYLQEYFSNPGDPISSAQWEGAEEPFLEVVEKLAPDYILCFGSTMYAALPEGGGCKDKRVRISHPNKSSIEIWKYEINDHVSRIIEMEHPRSRGYSHNSWSKVLNKIL